MNEPEFDLPAPLPENFAAHLLTVPENEYHVAARRGEFLSSHALARFRRSPAAYHRWRIGTARDEDSPALAFGRAAHALVLEGIEAFEDRYTTDEARPVNPKTGKPFGSATKEYQNFLASVAPREVVEARDFEAMLAMKRAVEGNDEARRRVRGGVAERVAREHYAGFECQVRADYITRDFGVCDLKTCRDLDRFEWDARDFGYIHQLAFYRAVLRVALAGNGGRDIPCSIVACEKAEPFRCGVWRVAPWALDIAEKQNEADMARLAECYRTDTWPEPPEYAGLRTLDFPGSRE